MHMYYEHAIQKYKEQHNLAAFRPKAVLFDMDGVLFDSMPNHARSWAKVCTEYGLEMTPEEAYMHEGRTGASTINLLAQRYWHRDATEKEISDIYAEKCRLFNACPEAGRMPGAMELLTQVKAAGLTIVVVTGSGQQSLLSRLESNYPGFFRPELMGLQKAGVRAEEALVVENAPLGVRAAVAAGIFTVAVNTGPLPEHALIGEGANQLFPSMQAFADAWQDFFACF